MEKIISDIDPYTFTGSAMIIGLFLTNELTLEEQDSIGNWLQLVGLIIQTYSSQVDLVNSSQETNEDTTTSDIETLKKAIQKIQDKLDHLN